MKAKVEECFDPTKRSVKLQVQSGGKWFDFGTMNFVERRELANQLEFIAWQLTRSANEEEPPRKPRVRIPASGMKGDVADVVKG